MKKALPKDDFPDPNQKETLRCKMRMHRWVESSTSRDKFCKDWKKRFLV